MRRVGDGAVDALRVVVRDVLAEQPSQMGFVQNHHVVQELPAHGADEALCRPVLPGTLERRNVPKLS